MGKTRDLFKKIRNTMGTLHAKMGSIKCQKNYGWRFVTLYRRQGSRPSPKKRNAKRQNSCLKKAYKWLRKEEKQMAKEKRKDVPI